MAYNRNLYTSADSALDAAIIYDQDQQLMQDEINAGVKNGDIVVGLADNLASSMNQYSTGEFVLRTAGGDASISDGNGYLLMIRGNSKHTGYSAQSVVMTVTNAARGEGEEEITAVIDEDTFIGQMESASGTFTLSYTSSWNYTPATYGITVVGTAKSGDSISVVYAKEVRGTIYQATLNKFVSSGWNLYDHSKQYARVIKYSNTYGFGVSGTYTNLEFATSITGERSAVTVTNGKFTVPNNGYIFVTGGNNTNTAIWMTWSDWTNGYVGDWVGYSTSSIDLSSIVSTYFPYGLCAVGSYSDEINLGLKTATNNVARLSYSSENLATVKALNVEYDYDENYIYYVLESPIINSINIDNVFIANDHGLEWFTVTNNNVALYAQTLYGENLKNRLERDVVLKSGDTMTGELKIAPSAANPCFRLQNNNIDTTASSAAESHLWHIISTDSADRDVFHIRTVFNGEDGKLYSLYMIRRWINNAWVNNYFRLGIMPNGTKEVYLSNPELWRSALNVSSTNDVVLNTGGSISGNLDVAGVLTNSGGINVNGSSSVTNLHSNGNIYIRANDITPGAASSASLYKGLLIRDVNNNEIANIRAYKISDGSVSGLQLNGRRTINGTNHQNYVHLGINSSGDRIVEMSNPEAWLTGLGLGSVTSSSTASNIVSAASGCSITSVTFNKWGLVAQLQIKIKITSANSTAGNVTLATLKDGYRPKTSIYAMSSNLNSHHCSISSAGVIQMYGTNTANQEVTISATYILS